MPELLLTGSSGARPATTAVRRRDTAREQECHQPSGAGTADTNNNNISNGADNTCQAGCGQ